MNAIFDLFTNQIKGVNRDPFPAEGSIDLPYVIVLSKTIEESTGNLIQKLNDEGLSLFKEPLDNYDEFGDPIASIEYIETTKSREVTEWEEVTHTYKIIVGETIEDSTDEEGNPIQISVPIYEEINTVEQVPLTWVDYEPIMIPEVLLRTYTFEQNPFLFTKDEVINAKEQSIIDAENAPPTEMENIQSDVLTLEGAVDFIIMNP